MKLALPLLLLPALVPATQQTPAFGPAEGATAVKRFAETVTWDIDSAVQTMAGQRNEAEIDAIGQELVRVVAVRDTYERPTGGPDGGPGKVVRVVDELTERSTFDFAAGGSETSFATVARSPLEEAELHLAWDADLERYLVTDPDGEESPDHAGLLEDLDLRGLLPDGDAEEGAEWTVPVEALVHALRAGGDWRLEPDGVAPGEYSMETLLPEDVLAVSLLRTGHDWDDVDGEVRATWTGTEDGRARIALEVELALGGDLSEAWERRIEAAGYGSDREDLVLEVLWDLEGDGELVWDLAAGRFAAFDLSLAGEGEVEAGWLQPVGESSIEVGMEAELSVALAFEARADVE